jgi:hypothetical protein
VANGEDESVVGGLGRPGDTIISPGKGEIDVTRVCDKQVVLRSTRRSSQINSMLPAQTPGSGELRPHHRSLESIKRESYSIAIAGTEEKKWGKGRGSKGHRTSMHDDVGR